ncbi:hypothetical protein C0993_004458 [Termitomyces sp. T159_Od127]|nr:hypothetical protein C0993_004458 [Termitomyces sp. T159_Od127]
MGDNIVKVPDNDQMLGMVSGSLLNGVIQSNHGKPKRAITNNVNSSWFAKPEYSQESED